MAAGEDEIEYVIRTEAVRHSIVVLLQQRIHPYLPAYLHLRQQAARQETLTEIAPDWNGLGEYLQLPGGPYGKPHFRPFWNTKQASPWLGRNLAGSYSPSSLREVPLRVVAIHGDKFELRPNHWELARQHLMDDQRIPALPLASFFLRDYAILATRPPERSELVDLFFQAFGYQSPVDDEEVAFLFDRDWAGPDGDWFEALAGVDA